MENGQLMNFYDTLKKELNNNNDRTSNVMSVGSSTIGLNHPNAIAFKRKAVDACNDLKDKCYKHVLLDIYCKVTPLDADYVANNMGMMSNQIDSSLASKGITATQYFKSAAKNTNAPLVEFVMHSIDNIGKAYMEAEDAKLKDAQENDLNVEAPESPDPMEDPDVESQLVDVEKDEEYETFIDKLKKKTINKIVSDISKIIANKKEESEMTFDTHDNKNGAMEESVASLAMDYAEKRLYKEGVELTPECHDEIVALAISEATLNEIDKVFQQPNSGLNNIKTAIRMGKGMVMNESAMTTFMESNNLK